MTEDYPDWNSYNYTMNNPINLIDPDGNTPISWPPKWYTNLSNQYNKLSPAEKNLPKAYWGIGYQMRYNKGSHTVGTIATNFSLMGSSKSGNSILSPETKTSTGSINGIRHATLSAMSYAKFLDSGVNATLSAHENNVSVDPKQTIFKTYNEVDMAADFTNNQMGKQIADELGMSGPFTSNKDIFSKVLDKAFNEGVWQGVKTKNGYELKQIKLTEKVYCQLKDALLNKDNNAEWK